MTVGAGAPTLDPAASEAPSPGPRGDVPPRQHDPARVIAFSDGIFAIAITLLILPLTDTQFDRSDLTTQLVNFAPRIGIFVLGFTVIGLMWLSHHSWFSRIVAFDDALLKINLGLLLCVAFLPFPTAVLGTQPGSSATMFFAAAVAVTGAAFVATWVYLLHHPHLLEPGVAGPLRRHAAISAVAPVVFAASIPVAALSPGAGKLFWLLIWPASIVVRQVIDRRSRRTQQ